MRFNCYIVGEDVLVSQCAEVLTCYQHNVMGIVTCNPQVTAWASNNNTPVLDSLTDLEKQIQQEPCDYLIVLDHSVKLPKSLSQYLNKKIIFFYNTISGGEQKYAAAQSILNNMTEHVVAWCLKTDNEGEVDILCEHEIFLDDHETSLTLNLKIYESAIRTFRALLQKITSRNGLTTKRKQRLNDKKRKYDITLLSGVIDWRESAENIYALYRALQFGSYKNDIGLVTFFIKDVGFVPTELQIIKKRSLHEVGTLVDVTDHYLQISASGKDIRIYGVKDLNGRVHSIKELANSFKLCEGGGLSKIGQTAENMLNKRMKEFRDNEQFWLKKLSKIASENILPNKALLEGESKKNIINSIFISKKMRRRLEDVFALYNLEQIMLSIILVYLFRINGNKSFTVKLHGLVDVSTAQFGDLLSPYVPLICNLQECSSFYEVLSYVNEQVESLKQHLTYRRDIFLRYPDMLEMDALIRSCIDVSFYSDLASQFAKECQQCITVTNECVDFSCPAAFLSDIRNKTILSNMKNHIQNLIQDIATYPDKLINDLSILNKKEEYKLTQEWNATKKSYPKNTLVHQLFEKQAASRPDDIAAVYDKDIISYYSLNIQANKLAHYLKRRGIKQGSLVGIVLDRSLNMIISILAVLKAGGSYVPISPSCPVERARYILSSCCRQVITDESVPLNMIELIKNEANLIRLDQDKSTIDSCSGDNLNIVADSDSLAYVLYTSGTTGWPKGVKISHRALINHMCWMQKEFNFDAKDVVLQKTPFTFDASVWEIFMPILTGGKLVFALRNVQSSPIDMIQQINQHGVTTLQLVPSMLKEFLRQEELKIFCTLRQIFSGGELLTSDIKREFFNVFGSKVKLHNLYGPTEATIEVASHTCKNTPEEIEFNIIGKPIYNTQIYILDDNQKLLPICVTGELYIAGDSLSKGYLNNEKLTNEKFIPNVFSKEKGAKLYRTGDLARWLPNGFLEILGRLDGQVKIRGFRIELAEVEKAILSHPLVQQCAVVVKKDKLGHSFLAAYLETQDDDKKIVGALKEFLKSRLPEYMIPSVFLCLKQLPLSSHGKLDRKALLDIDVAQFQKSEHYVPPKTFEEKQLVQIWEEVLNCNHVGIEDDFFSLGGHSLSVLQVLSRIKNSMGIDLSIQDVINYPTITQLIGCLDNYLKQKSSKTTKVQDVAMSNSVISLRGYGYKTPLFLIHPVGGTIFWYIHLAKLLDADRPIYAIQDPGIAAKNIVFESIEEMAESYLTAIKEIQPHGPYLIGGASFGSTVALEIAKQLHKIKEQINFIPLLDGWAFYPDTLLDFEIFQETMSRQYVALRSKFATANITNKIEDLLELQRYRINMLWDYKLERVDDPLVLFKAEDLLPVFKNIESPCNHWDNYTSQPIPVHIIPGNHETMFEEPNVRVLATQMNNYLKVLS